ncbi:MAG: ABC transporter ATP-binding protein [Lachnospiraceae bacterium]|nr:ABC transporter ATP-binding protein [Lachnospiraceae bacterium]
MNIIETKGLTKTYGKSRGINDLNLIIEEGDFFGFIGPNGAGKSTTIRTLLGLISPTGGSAKIMGCDIVKENRQILSRVGYLPSEINFYSKMKVKDVIRYSASLRKADCHTKAMSLCERLGLDITKNVDELSLGNRKKVGIVCAVQHSPQLLILDEPTSGLDPLMQHEFFNILTEENKNGATIFFSSHILSEVQNYCRTAAFIKDGRIIMSDSVDKLEETGAKKVSVTGNAPELEAALKESAVAKYISDLQSGDKGESVAFLYNGKIPALLELLAEMKPKDLTITEPSLEEIFMNYYES